MKHLSIHFYIRKHRSRQNGKAPIYMRLTVNGKRAELSTSRKIDPERWDSNSNQVKGRKPDAVAINKHLDLLKNKVYRAHSELSLEEEEVTAVSIKNRLTGQDKVNKTIKELFKTHNKRMKTLIGKDYSDSTYKKYKTALYHLLSFLRHKYGNEELPISRVTHTFLDDFEYFLKTNQKLSHNTAMKYIGNFKKIVFKAVKEGWLAKDPFDKYTHKFKKKDPVYLTQNELESIENKSFDVERLNRVKDVFIFSCYTALAFSDAKKLTNSDIKTDNKGNKYLTIYRTKTDKVSKIPLLPPALEIIDKYKDDPETKDGNLLPMKSNQKTNAYLKEIADLCGVTKKLTHHVARHTCATTVMLGNGINIETAQEVMGHADIRSTQHYARVTTDKVNKEFKALAAIIS